MRTLYCTGTVCFTYWEVLVSIFPWLRQHAENIMAGSCFELVPVSAGSSVCLLRDIESLSAWAVFLMAWRVKINTGGGFVETVQKWSNSYAYKWNTFRKFEPDINVVKICRNTLEKKFLFFNLKAVFFIVIFYLELTMSSHRRNGGHLFSSRSHIRPHTAQSLLINFV